METLKIKPCPQCGKSHEYRLNVSRTIVIGSVISILTSDGAFEQPRKVWFTRLFTCPKTNQDFQARFFLTDSSSSEIRSVSVAGLVDDATK